MCLREDMAPQGRRVWRRGPVRLVEPGLSRFCPDRGRLNEIASASDSLVARAYDHDADFGEVLADHRASAAVLGPGAGPDERLKQRVLSACRSQIPLVLDADALSVFRDEPDRLFEALHDTCVLTPHGGEFERLFPDLTEKTGDGNKIERTRLAARRCGAVVVFKGQIP